MHDFGDLDQELVTRVLECALRVSIGYRRVMLTAKGRPSSPVCLLFLGLVYLFVIIIIIHGKKKEEKADITLHKISSSSSFEFCSLWLSLLISRDVSHVCRFL